MITREQFDAANEALYAEMIERGIPPNILAAQAAYAELLSRKLFGEREKAA